MAHDDSIYLHLKNKKTKSAVKALIKTFETITPLGKKVKVKDVDYFAFDTMINDAPAVYIYQPEFILAFDDSLIMEIAYPDTLDWRVALENMCSVDNNLKMYDLETVQSILYHDERDN